MKSVNTKLPQMRAIKYRNELQLQQHTLNLLQMKQRLAPVWRAQPNGTDAVENDQSRLDHTMQRQYNSTLH